MTRSGWSPDTPPAHRSAWLLLPGVATALGLVGAAQAQYDRAAAGDPITWSHALIHGLPGWYAWALLVPVVLHAARRIEERKIGAAAGLALHLLIGAAVTFLQVGLFSFSSSLLHGDPASPTHLGPSFQNQTGLAYLGGLMTYALLVGGWYAWDRDRRDRDRERETARLELRAARRDANLAEARLRHSRARLQPDFLFNALHALGGLILEGENREAVRMTALLSDLLRRSLRAAESREIPLEEELRLVSDYLAVQRLRFGDRLRVTVEAHPHVRGSAVPPLILQPLVENAVRHGIEADPNARRVAVRCRPEHGHLVLTVEDDGPGPPATAALQTSGEGAEAAKGGGIETARARLRDLYGDDAHLTLGATPRGGARATIRLPRREAGPTGAGTRAPADRGAGAAPPGRHVAGDAAATEESADGKAGRARDARVPGGDLRP